MQTRYGQFCPVAKASEIFATRWTPLVLRELMAGMHTFNDIHRGVPLISRAVLVKRLRELEHQGIIERRQRAEGAGHEYWLTPAGEAFRAVVDALGHWGATYTRDRFARAETHDELWNATQREMLRRGTIHGYYRMYWGKKVIEWSPTYQDALYVA